MLSKIPFEVMLVNLRWLGFLWGESDFKFEEYRNVAKCLENYFLTHVLVFYLYFILLVVVFLWIVILILT